MVMHQLPAIDVTSVWKLLALHWKMEGCQCWNRKWRCWSPQCIPLPYKSTLAKCKFPKFSKKLFTWCKSLASFQAVPCWGSVGRERPSGTQLGCDPAGGHLPCSEHQVSCARLERSQRDLWNIVTAPSRRDSLAQEPITASPQQCQRYHVLPTLQQAQLPGTNLSCTASSVGWSPIPKRAQGDGNADLGHSHSPDRET